MLYKKVHKKTYLNASIAVALISALFELSKMHALRVSVTASLAARPALPKPRSTSSIYEEIEEGTASDLRNQRRADEAKKKKEKKLGIK